MVQLDQLVWHVGHKRSFLFSSVHRRYRKDMGGVVFALQGAHTESPYVVINTI